MKPLTKKLPILLLVFGVTFYITLKQTNVPVSPTIVIMGDTDFREDIKYALKVIQETKSTANLVNDLKKTGKTVYIVQDSNKTFCGVPKGNIMAVQAGKRLDSFVHIGYEFDAPIYLVLAHEMRHALDFAQGTFNLDTAKVRPGVSGIEDNAMTLENKMEAELGLPIRLRHD